MKLNLNFLEEWSLFKTIFISLAILGICIFGFYFVIVNNYLIHLETLKDENRLAQARLSKERELFSKRNALKANLEILKRFESLAKTQLPENRDIPMILSSIENLSREIGIKVYSFIPQKEVLKDSYVEIPVEITFDGTYEQIQIFVDEISRFTRILNVNDLELKDPVGYALHGKVSLKGKMLLSAFRQLTEEERLAKEEQSKEQGQKTKQNIKKEGGLISRDF